MKIRNKLTSRRGETLTETLVGVLIVGLASAVLAVMVAAASHINATAIARDEALYAAVTKAESGTVVSGKTVKVEVTVDAESHIFTAPETNLCGDETVPLYAYRYQKGGTP